MTTCVQLDSISVKYGSSWIFRDIDLEIRPCDKIAVLGKNGSGKSTLLKCMAGLIEPTAGKVRFLENGTLSPIRDHRRKMAFVAPYSNLYDELTLEEHLNVLVEKSSVNTSTLRENLLFWGLENVFSKELGNYSSGMKQRAKFFLSGCGEKNICVIWDEPFTNLDSEGIEKVNLYRNKLLEQGIPLVIASNDPKEHMGITDIVLLE